MWSLTLLTLLVCSVMTTIASSTLQPFDRYNLIPSISSFSVDLYKEVAKTETCDIILSPFSAQTILSLVLQGAVGQTAIDIAEGLKYTQPPAVVAESYQTLLAPLQNNTMLKTANKIYIQQNYTAKPEFQLIASRDYYSIVESVNFEQNQATANKINSWVESQTDNLINNLISPSLLDGKTRMVLVNAIYFKGTWEKPFTTRLTKKSTFYGKTNASIDIMTTTDHFNYVADDYLDAKILELPYKNSNLSMFVYLPNSNNGLSRLESKLRGVDLTNVLQSMTPHRVTVSFPKFKSALSVILNKALINMGLERIFSNAANFSGMLQSNESLKVSAVVQKAYIEVNEVGSKAAAATAIIMTRTLGMFSPFPITVFNADHPFIYTIQVRTGAPYFMGRFKNCQ